MRARICCCIWLNFRFHFFLKRFRCTRDMIRYESKTNRLDMLMIIMIKLEKVTPPPWMFCVCLFVSVCMSLNLMHVRKKSVQWCFSNLFTAEANQTYQSNNRRKRESKKQLSWIAIQLLHKTSYGTFYYILLCYMNMMSIHVKIICNNLTIVM